jgi:hypothetical protein
VRSLVRSWSLVVVASLLAVFARELTAQDPVRPWLRWRTIQTASFRIHATPELEPWARHVAARVESIDSAVSAMVGFSARKPIDVVVDDPFRLSNGYAVPYLDRPVTVWWATPADPRNDIGNYRAWGEMLAVHEIAHLAHMSRPSRNPLRRLVNSSIVNLGPIATRAPRWVYEGYATLVEGRVTGSGRPNNVWRPAILRQWAIEGRLPAYWQLAAWNDFNGGEFAYLGGSAFFDWLATRDGDSSFVLVWRRLTARRVRTFDAAFAGVYGDAPATLYGRHVAELTRDAMAVKDALERAGLRDGELIQRLAWDTGDPAISPNGQRVAIALRERDRPGRIVVWRTAPEPEDTAEIRRRIDALKRDPLDVPERRVYPRPKRIERALLALNGRSYQMPRWLSDNRRVLLTRWAPLSDGSSVPDLYIWDSETGDVHRLTHGKSLLHGDPHPNSREAVALQCHFGRCDVVRVDLAHGQVTTILAGTPERTYARPRYSRDGARILASVSEGGRWRVVITDRTGQTTLIDPADGANRFDANWISDDTVVAVSERGGIANLESISVATGQIRSLTRVTGAALGPDVNRTDGSIWFLSMHSRGLDVRRLAPQSPRADTVVSIDAQRFGLAAPRGVSAGIALRERPVPASRPYGSGSRFSRWLPGAHASADGAGGSLTIFSGDIIGRLNATLTGALGRNGTTQGAYARATWRYPRPAIEFGALGALHEPSLGPHPQPRSDSLDAEIVQGIVALSGERRADGVRLRARAGGSLGKLSPRLGDTHSRVLGFGEADLFLQRSIGSRGIATQWRGHITAGRTDAPYRRLVGSVRVATVGREMIPLDVEATVGRVSGNPLPYERFTLGGIRSPVGDSSLFSQRYAMPGFPTGIAVGHALVAWRVSLPGGFWTPFYESAGVAPSITDVKDWNRAVGLEARYVFGPMPTAFIPRVDLRGGAAYALSDPFRKKVRAFLEMRIEP